MLTVTFTPDEWDEITQHAHDRNEANKRAGVPNERMVDLSDEEVNLIGVAGEEAVSRVLYGSPSRSLDWGDPPDVVLFGGLTVEVKTTTQREYSFFLETDRIEDWEDGFGVLVWPHPSPRTVEVVGWTTPLLILQHGYIEDRGRGDQFWQDWRDLYPIEQLQDQIKKINQSNV